MAQAFNRMVTALETQQAAHTARLEALLRLNEMSSASFKEIADFALEEAVCLTRSTIGYLAFFNDDESVLTMFSWSRAAMEKCAIADMPLEYPVADTGLWGEAVRRRRPVITNDYAAANLDKKDYPAGYVELRRHMNVPIFDGERIVLLAGVGNKDEFYDETDVRQLTLLMQGLWRTFQRKRAEEALRQEKKSFPWPSRPYRACWCFLERREIHRGQRGFRTGDGVPTGRSHRSSFPGVQHLEKPGRTGKAAVDVGAREKGARPGDRFQE